MSVVLVIVGAAIVIAVWCDVVNTLVTTMQSRGRWWLTVVMYTTTWQMIRWLGRLFDDRGRERLYAMFAPVSVIVMLMGWVALQIFGFGLIWSGVGGVDGVAHFGDSVYYSGVVYFTLGFGEIVPTVAVPRIGALVEAFSGVLTTALVIGYLPALYSAYSEREQKLLTLDDGTEGRITPTNLVLARCPDGNPRSLDSFFEGWEAWVAQVMETHTTFRMLWLFRSQHPGQHWVTALGVVTDAALHMQMMRGSDGRASYWMLRRATRLLHTFTEHSDLSAKRAEVDSIADTDRENDYFRAIYAALEAHGFPMLPYDEAFARARELRVKYEVELEEMIDALDAPRGFWGHEIGHRLESPRFVTAD